MTPARTPVGVPDDLGPDPPVWARRELAWPLSLAAGFAGTWLGLMVPVPGAAPLLATAAILPLYLWFQERGDARYSTFLALGWLIGSSGAIVGLALENELDLVLDRVLLARWAAEHWIAPWLPRGTAAPPPGGGSAMLALLGFSALVLAVARWQRGLLLLLGIAVLGGAVAGVAAWGADRGARYGLSPLAAAALAWPPFLVVLLGALLSAGGALAEPLPLRPWSSWSSWRRRALVLGLPLALGAALLHGLTNDLWGHWLASQLGG